MFINFRRLWRQWFDKAQEIEPPFRVVEFWVCDEETGSPIHGVDVQITADTIVDSFHRITDAAGYISITHFPKRIKRASIYLVKDGYLSKVCREDLTHVSSKAFSLYPKTEPW